MRISVARAGALGICVLAASALAIDYYKIVPANEVITKPTQGASCGGGCPAFNAWGPGNDCAEPSSSGSQDVICQPGTVFIDQFGVAHCMQLSGWSTYTVGIPYCARACPNGTGGGGGEP